MRRHSRVLNNDIKGDDYLVIQRAKAEIDRLLRQRSWLDAAYADGDIDARDRRDIAQQLAEIAIQLQLYALLITIHTTMDDDRRHKLRREYLRKRMTLHPPTRSWLRYLVVGVAAAAVVLVLAYAVPILVIR